MVTADNVKQVSLTVDLTKKFDEITKRERQRRNDENLKVGTVVNEYLRKALYYEEQLQLAKSFVTFKGYVDDDRNILLWDNVENHSVTLEPKVKNGRHILYCREDKSDRCMHAGFAFVNPDVSKKLIASGFKPPKEPAS